MTYEKKYLKYLGKNNLVGGYKCAVCYSNGNNMSYDMGYDMGYNYDLTRCESCGMIVCSSCVKKYVLNKCPREDKLVSWIIIPKTYDNYKEQEQYFVPETQYRNPTKPIGYIEQTILEPVSVAPMPIGYMEPTILEPVPIAPMAFIDTEIIKPVFLNNISYGVPMNIIID